MLEENPHSVTLARDVVAAVSVGELVRRQLGIAEDPWELALVQRDLVWQADRMTALLDSLLARYPIGALLLCQVDRESDTRPQGTLQGHERRVSAMTPQLVDGQQRSHALLSLFTDRGYGRFYLDLAAEWTRRGDYIAWLPSDVPDGEGVSDVDESRRPDPRRFADLALMSMRTATGELWADTISLPITDPDLESVVAALGMTTMTIPTDATERTQLRLKLNRLLDAWHEPRIPVVTAVVDAPEDILELFTRVNRGGEAVSQNDLYFAAVKTFWHDPDVEADVVSAKAALDQIVEATGGLLDLWGALSLVSRLALAGLGEGDIVPLRVERLSRANKDFIIQAIRACAPVIAERVAPFVSQLREASELKQGLRFVHRQLWEEVLAWAVVSSRGEVRWNADDIDRVESYVMAASLFGYASRLRDPYRRDAMRVCLNAAMHGSSFPLSDLRAVAWRAEGLRRGRAAVLASTDHQALAKANSALVIAAAQALDDDVRGLDWDHLVPASWRSKFRLPRGSGRQYREEAKHLNDPGNFWQIDLSANREVQAAAPRSKFARIEKFDPAGKGRVAPSRNSGIDPDHLPRFISVGDALESGDDMAVAAARFAALINERNDWLIRRIYEGPRGAVVRSFGSDHPAEAIEPPPLAEGLDEVLGIKEIRSDLEAAIRARRKKVTTADLGIEAILAPSGEWAGLGERLLSVLRDVTLKHAKLSGAGVRSWIFKNASKQTAERAVPILPIDAQDRLLLIATGRNVGDGAPPFWIKVTSDSPNAVEMWERLRAAGDIPIDLFNGAPAIPVRVGPEMSWNEMRETVDKAFSRVREVLEQDALAN